MRRNGLAVAGLVILLVLLDQLYRVLHPEVNLVRASLVGGSAWLSLVALGRAGLGRVPAARGSFAIAASAFGSVLLIQAGWLVSRSPSSAAVHVLLLALAWLAAGQASRQGAVRAATRA